jgi:hypothetical protein
MLEEAGIAQDTEYSIRLWETKAIPDIFNHTILTMLTILPYVDLNFYKNISTR